MTRRRCSRSGCQEAAVATLTFAYAESTAVVGPLAVRNEPGTYDLCPYHARGLSVPRGWEVIRLPLDTESDLPNDLLALADAVREAAGLETETPPPTMVEVARRGHLTLLEVQPPAST